MSYLTMVNSVLRFLREDTVTSVSDTDYSTLIGKFVNLAKEEVENAAAWNVLRGTIQVTTVADTYSYTLTSSNYKSRVLDVFNDTEDCWLREKSSKFMTQFLNTSPIQSDSPLYYGINGVDSSGYLLVDLWPVPDAVETINFNMVLTEAEMDDDADTTSLPETVIVLGAWALAISERGEDGGISYSEADHRFKQALNDAVALDATHHPDEWIMEVV